MKHCEHVFKTINSSHSAAHNRVSASWYRSNKKYGLDPEHTSDRIIVTQNDLINRQEKANHLLQIASSQLDKLFSLVGSDGCGVFLTDKDGVIIDQRCTDANLGTFALWGLCIGASWHEMHEGTNGIGTCIEEERNIIIHKDQHFLSKNTDISCIDAPIYGADGSLIAALDVSSARSDQASTTNKLIGNVVSQTASLIETAYFKQTYSDARIVLLDKKQCDQNMLLAINSDDVIIGATRAARKSLEWAVEGPIQPVAADDIYTHHSHLEGFNKSQRVAIVGTLARTNGNISKAAKILGIGRATMYRHMQRLGIERNN